MKKIILALSLFLSVLGIIGSFIFVFLDFESLSAIMDLLLFSVRSYTFSGLSIYIPRHQIAGKLEYSTISLGLVNLFFYLSFLTGAVIYYFSNLNPSTKLHRQNS